MSALPDHALPLVVPTADDDRPTRVLTDQDLADFPATGLRPRYACGVCRHLIFVGESLGALQERYPSEERLGLSCAKCGATNLARVGPRPAGPGTDPAQPRPQ